MEPGSTRSKKLDLEKGGAMRTQKAVASRRTKKRATAIKKAPTIKLLPALAPSVTDVINNWSPNRNALAHKHWIQIAPIVRTHLLAQNIKGPSLALKYIRALSYHTACRHSLGHAITKPEDLFSDAALTTTYGSAIVSNKSTETKRKELVFMRRMRANLLPDLYAKSKDLVQPSKAISLPYSEKEITQMLSFARQRTSNLCIMQHGAILLSLAAGLTSAEISNARGSDLVATPWGLFIDTQGLPSGRGRGPRQVPIRAEYENELSTLAREIGDDLFLALTPAGENRDPGSLTSRAAKGPHFKTNRARSTWLLEILRSEVPFIALRQAGVPIASDKQLVVLSKGLELSFDQYVIALRGSAIPFDQSKHKHLMQYGVGQ